jgi:hypothetical protein
MLTLHHPHHPQRRLDLSTEKMHSDEDAFGVQHYWCGHWSPWEAWFRLLWEQNKAWLWHILCSPIKILFSLVKFFYLALPNHLATYAHYNKIEYKTTSVNHLATYAEWNKIEYETTSVTLKESLI